MTGKKLVLVVDDEFDIRESVKLILEDENFKVITAENGDDCLEKLKSIKPDIIILDILMPGMKTKDVVTEIRKKMPAIPIIFLTVVRLSEANKQKIITGNMADYIEKPFNNENLVWRVRKALKEDI